MQVEKGTIQQKNEKFPFKEVQYSPAHECANTEAEEKITILIINNE